MQVTKYVNSMSGKDQQDLVHVNMVEAGHTTVNKSQVDVAIKPPPPLQLILKNKLQPD